MLDIKITKNTGNHGLDGLLFQRAGGGYVGPQHHHVGYLRVPQLRRDLVAGDIDGLHVLPGHLVGDDVPVSLPGGGPRKTH